MLAAVDEDALDLLEVLLDEAALFGTVMKSERATLSHLDDAVDGVRVQAKNTVSFPKCLKVLVEGVGVPEVCDESPDVRPLCREMTAHWEVSRHEDAPRCPL